MEESHWVLERLILRFVLRYLSEAKSNSECVMRNAELSDYC